MKNTPIYIFFCFWFKNKQVWAEKIGKKWKNSKNIQFFYMKNQNNQLLKLWFLQATETLCHLSVTDIKKRFCNVWFFCINEACVNCGKENATTLTWLLRGGGLTPRFSLPYKYKYLVSILYRQLLIIYYVKWNQKKFNKKSLAMIYFLTVHNFAS